MEYERFGGNTKLFIFGIICLVVSLGLLFFSLYILPYFLWELSYDVPDFILNMLAKYQDDYHYTSARSKTIVWLLFFVPCVITGFISYFVSRYLDKKMYGTDSPVIDGHDKSSSEIQKEIRESVSLGGKIIGLMIIIFIVFFLLQYFIQATA